jgi:type II secretory pathway component PulF
LSHEQVPEVADEIGRESRKILTRLGLLGDHGESTGGIDTALRNVAYFYNREVQESISKVQGLIEPMLTLVMGGVLGWLMMAVLGPMYDLIAKIKF